MQDFARLYADLDASTATLDKLAALSRYLVHARDADAAWAVYLLAGGKPRQAVPTAVLRGAATQAAGIDDWLFEASYQAVGDLAETIALILPTEPSALVDPDPKPDLDADTESGIATAPLAVWMGTRLPALRGLDATAQAAQLRTWWRALDPRGRFVLVKLIGGGWRVGVSKLLVQRAVAAHAGLEAALVAQRMMGYTDARRTPDAAAWQALVEPAMTATAGDGLTGGAPYPFCLAHPTEEAPDGDGAPLGPVTDWQAEWKYDGVRAQIVRREGQCWIWSRGEELVTERFPEVRAAAMALPEGCVLDGELLVWDGERPAPFARLQQRLNRKTVGRTLLTQVPVGFIAYDLLESEGRDRRSEPLQRRRERLDALCAPPSSTWPASWRVSPALAAEDWAGLARQRMGSREHGVEGLMLKHRDGVYGIGRHKGSDGLTAWWKWKVAPMTLDAVLLYAQAGHGRRANLYTDYTFAVWNRRPTDAAEAQSVVDAITRREPAEPGRLTLVTLAKAYSGLSDAEFARVDREVRAHTLEKFGPVRSVRPTLVFELAFEGIGTSPRHKSGLALRFPRMLRIRDDKPLHEADDLDALRRGLPGL